MVKLILAFLSTSAIIVQIILPSIASSKTTCAYSRRRRRPVCGQQRNKTAFLFISGDKTNENKSFQTSCSSKRNHEDRCPGSPVGNCNHHYHDDVGARHHKNKDRSKVLLRLSRSLFGNSIERDEIPFQRSTICVSKPLGIVIEECDENNPSEGVMIASMDPLGNTVQSRQPCYVGDRIISIEGEDCSHNTFEGVMDRIISCNKSEIELTLERPLANSQTNYTVVEFPNHVCITAQSGDVLGALAQEAGYGESITYSCRNGGCGTCEHAVDIYNTQSSEQKKEDDKVSRRYIRPCVSRIPKSAARIRVLSPYEEKRGDHKRHDIIEFLKTGSNKTIMIQVL